MLPFRSPFFSRRGISVLTLVLFFGLVVGLVVMGYQSLRQGSARTLFTVHEHRQLINLGRSALAEATFFLQNRLNRRDPVFFYWFAWRRRAPDHTMSPTQTRKAADAMMGKIPGRPYEGNVEYSASDVAVVRSKPLDPGRVNSSRGMVDLKVTVKVTRKNPRHQAEMTLIERRYYALKNLDGTGSRVFLSEVPVATMVVDPVE